MNAHSRKKAGWWLLLAGFLALLGWPVARRNNDIKAIESAIDRDWEISLDRTSGEPAWLPALVDSTAQAWFDWRYGDSYDETHPVKTRNRSVVYYQRFRCLFRAPLEYIGIWYPQKFRGDDLGAALARFPKLRFFGIYENDEPGPSESDWTLLCRRLRALPQLEEIELGGYWLTDAAIAPLAGHSNLHVVTISDGRLSPGCVKTFAAIPHLAKLHIEGQRYDGNSWLSRDEEKTMRAFLPGVTLEVP